MSFKDILSKLDQLSEGDVKHTGTYGTSYGKEDVRDQYGHKIGKVNKDAETKKDAPKKGRGRPKKGADETGEVKKYDFSAFGVKPGKDIKLPKHDKDKTTKHSLKEYFDKIDEMMNQQPIPVIGKQGDTQSTGAGFLNIDDSSPAGQAMKDAIGKLAQQKKAQIVMPTGTQQSGTQQKATSTSGGATNQPAMAEEDVGKHNNATTGFAALVKKLTPKYGVEAAKRIAGAQLKKIKEADLPPQDGLMGAGLGAGRNQGVTEAAKPDFIDLDKDGNKKESMKKAAQDKKKVKEGMDHKLKAAHHAGKSHALSKQGYNCSYDDMEEARMYHDGFKEGLDECYGQLPIRGQVVGEEGNVVDDMASFGAHTPAMEDEMDEGNAFTAALAKTPKGGKFSVGGKTFTDHTGYDAKVDEMDSMFESWDNQLGSLLEEYQEIQEGMTVSISKGQQGAPDSVSVSAQDGEADQLLSIIKQAGLGLFGGDEQPQAGNSSAMSLQPADAGTEAPAEIDVVDDHDGMMNLIKKITGGAPKPSKQGFGDAGSSEHEHTHEEKCNECGGVMEEGHSCGDREEVDEVESEDQMEYQVAEDNPPDSGAEEFAAMDQEIATDNAAASSHGGAQNSNLEEEDLEEEEEPVADSESDSGEADASNDELDESYANSTDDEFQADIDFMTKIISGGLNKQKSTGQTTIPVIAGQDDRMGYSVKESLNDWKKLAGM
jgi:hypothetical protein